MQVDEEGANWSAPPSSGYKLGKIPRRNANCVGDPNVCQLTRGAELVYRRPAETEVLRDLAHRQELLGKLHETRGHRGDKRLLVRRGIASIQRIHWLSALNHFEPLPKFATRYQPRRLRGVELGCKWSLVQIQSPRQRTGLEFRRLGWGLQALRFCFRGPWWLNPGAQCGGGAGLRESGDHEPLFGKQRLLQA